MLEHLSALEAAAFESVVVKEDVGHVYDF